MQNTNQVLPALNGYTVHMPEGNHPREMYEIHCDGRLDCYAGSWLEAMRTLAWKACHRSAIHPAYSYGAYVATIHRIAGQVAREVYQARMQAEACR